MTITSKFLDPEDDGMYRQQYRPLSLKKKKLNINMGDFMILRVIGQGSMGKVMLVEHKQKSTVYNIIKKSNMQWKSS